MKPQTVVIIIVVVVVVLAASSWGIACSNDGGSDEPPDPMPKWVDVFQKAFVRRDPLPLQALQCRAGSSSVGSISGGRLNVNFNQPIRCTVAPEDGPKRVLEVENASGSVRFTGEIYGTRLSNEPIESGAENAAELVFEPEGGLFDLTCAGSCTVRMTPVDD